MARKNKAEFTFSWDDAGLPVLEHHPENTPKNKRGLEIDVDLPTRALKFIAKVSNQSQQLDELLKEDPYGRWQAFSSPEDRALFFSPTTGKSLHEYIGTIKQVRPWAINVADKDDVQHKPLTIHSDMADAAFIKHMMDSAGIRFNLKESEVIFKGDTRYTAYAGGKHTLDGLRVALPEKKKALLGKEPSANLYVNHEPGCGDVWLWVGGTHTNVDGIIEFTGNRCKKDRTIVHGNGSFETEKHFHQTEVYIGLQEKEGDEGSTFFSNYTGGIGSYRKVGNSKKTTNNGQAYFLNNNDILPCHAPKTWGKNSGLAHNCTLDNFTNIVFTGDAEKGTLFHEGVMGLNIHQMGETYLPNFSEVQVADDSFPPQVTLTAEDINKPLLRKLLPVIQLDPEGSAQEVKSNFNFAQAANSKRAERRGARKAFLTRIISGEKSKNIAANDAGLDQEIA